MSTTVPKSSAQTASSGPANLLAHPVDTMTAAAEHVPGASVVKGVANGVLDTVGAVSPHARRVAAYAGVGLLGVAGVVEWPVAAAGAAVVWLTQQRPKQKTTAAGQKAGAAKPAGTRAGGTRAGGAAEKKAKTSSKASASRSTGRRTTSSRTASSGTRKGRQG